MLGIGVRIESLCGLLLVIVMLCYMIMKNWRHPVRYNSIQPFCNFVFNNDLIDIGCKGDPFTWTNKQQDEDLVKGLDRALCNWFTQYNKAVVTYKEDHAPIQLCFHGFKRRVADQVHSVSRGYGSGEKSAQPWSKMHGAVTGSCNNKLKLCQEKLTYWDKANFSNTKGMGDEIKDRLEGLKSTIRSTDVIEEKKLLEELDRAWFSGKVAASKNTSRFAG
ncbi:hypothetical protein LINGRAHAP2_LOCUS29467 [Linum grandiflorum]